MTMRVFECNVCGELLSAVDDDALVRRLADHMRATHPETGVDEARGRQMIDEQAYTAADS